MNDYETSLDFISVWGKNMVKPNLRWILYLSGEKIWLNPIFAGFFYQSGEKIVKPIVKVSTMEHVI